MSFDAFEKCELSKLEGIYSARSARSAGNEILTIYSTMIVVSETTVETAKNPIAPSLRLVGTSAR